RLEGVYSGCVLRSDDTHPGSCFVLAAGLRREDKRQWQCTYAGDKIQTAAGSTSPCRATARPREEHELKWEKHERTQEADGYHERGEEGVSAQMEREEKADHAHCTSRSPGGSGDL